MEHNPIGGKNKINFSTSSPYPSTIQQSPYFSTPHILPPYTPYPSTIHPISFHHTPFSILILFEFLSPKILKTFKTLKTTTRASARGNILPPSFFQEGMK